MLKGDPWTPREQVFAEQASYVSLTGASLFTMNRDTRWKAVYILGSEEAQLFDPQQELDECHNLWNDPAHAPRARS